MSKSQQFFEGTEIPTLRFPGGSKHNQKSHAGGRGGGGSSSSSGSGSTSKRSGGGGGGGKSGAKIDDPDGVKRTPGKDPTGKGGAAAGVGRMWKAGPHRATHRDSKVSAKRPLTGKSELTLFHQGQTSRRGPGDMKVVSNGNIQLSYNKRGGHVIEFDSKTGRAVRQSYNNGGRWTDLDGPDGDRIFLTPRPREDFW